MNKFIAAVDKLHNSGRQLLTLVQDDVTLVREEATLVHGETTLMSDDATLVHGKTTLMPDDATLVRNEASLVPFGELLYKKTFTTNERNLASYTTSNSETSHQ
jgi:hypothetical protein